MIDTKIAEVIKDFKDRKDKKDDEGGVKIKEGDEKIVSLGFLQSILNANQAKEENKDDAKKYYKYRIPPDLQICRDYQKSTATGYVKSTFKRCKASLMYLDNRKFSLCSPVDHFAQMGTGYAQFFNITKWVIFMCVFPLMISSVFGLVRNYNGNDCVDYGYFSTLQEYLNQTEAPSARESRLLFDINRVSHLQNQEGGNSTQSIEKDDPAYDAFGAGFSSTRDSLRYFVSFYCKTKWLISDPDCGPLKDSGCFDEVSDICADLSFAKFKGVYEDKVCMKTLATGLSVANRVNKSMNSNSWFFVMRPFINAGTILILFIMLFFAVFRNEVLVILYDRQYTTVDDYTVYLKGLPIGDLVHDMDVDIDSIVKEAIQKKGYKVTQLNFVYDCEDYVNLRKEYSFRMNALKKEEYLKKNNPQDNQGEAESLINKDKTELYQLEKKLVFIEKNFDSSHPRGMIGGCFVSFYTCQQREKFLRDYKKRGFFYNLFGCAPNIREELKIDVRGNEYQLYCSRPHRPSNIIWENLNYGRSYRIIRRGIGLLLSLILFVIGFILLFFLYVLINNFTIMHKERANMTKTDELVELAAVYFGSSVVSGVDFILQYLATYIVLIEKPTSVTNQNVRISKMLWKMQFFSSAINPLLYSASVMNFFGRGGLIEIINGIFIANLWMNPLILLFGDVFFYLKKWNRYQVRQYILEGKGGVYTQMEADQIYKKQIWWVSYKYASLIKTFAFGLFYFPIMPYSIFYTFISLGIFYWIEKYLLITRCNKHYQYGKRLAEELMEEFKLCIIIYIFGLVLEENCIRFLNQKPLGVYWNTLFFLVFALILYFVDMRSFFKPFLPHSEGEHEENYFSMKLSDPNDYDLANPATSVLARGREADIGKHQVFFQGMIPVLANQDNFTANKKQGEQEENTLKEKNSFVFELSNVKGENEEEVDVD